MSSNFNTSEPFNEDGVGKYSPEKELLIMWTHYGNVPEHDTLKKQ